MSVEWAFSSLTELARGLSERRYSARELTEHFLGRIERANAKLHAFTEVYSEEAVAQATAADRQRASGMSLGPLHGLPIAVKDICDIQGRIGMVGSKAWETRRGKVTSTAVARLLTAGMVVLGKTHMVEFAFGGWGTNPLLGTPWNPWDLSRHRVPGGSSSGSGVAVSAGLAPAAIGSDTGGSVRLPAAFNGIVGLKTSSGLISLYGTFPFSKTLDTIGPLTRSVPDAALLLGALAGQDLHDPGTCGAPAVVLPDLDAPNVMGMRVALMVEEQWPERVAPAVHRAWHDAVHILRQLGAVVTERVMPFEFSKLAHLCGQLIASEAYATHRAYIEDERLAIGPQVRARIVAGRQVSENDYFKLRENQRRAAAQFVDWMGDSDVMLAPVVSIPAIPVDEIDENIALTAFTRPANYLGACAMALPAGFSPDGLPVAIQLLAKPFDEQALLRLGAAYERVTGWSRRSPLLDKLFARTDTSS